MTHFCRANGPPQCKFVQQDSFPHPSGAAIPCPQPCRLPMGHRTKRLPCLTLTAVATLVLNLQRTCVAAAGGSPASPRTRASGAPRCRSGLPPPLGRHPRRSRTAGQPRRQTLGSAPVAKHACNSRCMPRHENNGVPSGREHHRQMLDTGRTKRGQPLMTVLQPAVHWTGLHSAASLAAQH